MLKSLLPSLVLLAAYLAAEEIFGPGVGLAVAVVLGGGELLYTWFRHGRVDKTTAWSTLLFVVLGLFAVLAAGSDVERLQPVVVEGVTCILLGIFAFSRADILSTLPGASRRESSPEQREVTRRVTRVLYILLTTHALVLLAALFWFPARVAAFVAGPLLYLLMGLFFLALLARGWLLFRAAGREEWLPVVNEKGEVTGKATRRQCHSGARLLHPVVHLHVVDPRGDIFLQQRGMNKELLPGKWDTAVGGHVDSGESIEEALKRETLEELGITRFKARFLGSYVWESTRERELVFSFLCTARDDIRPNPAEIADSRFWPRPAIEDPANAPLFTPNFLHEYALFLQ
jgi:isopentenyldiphosphate isomerase